MVIRDIMSDPAVAIGKDTSVCETANVMREYNIGAVPVVDSNDNVVGIVTDRDIVIRNTARGLDPKTTSISDIMSENVTVVSPDAEIDDVADMMSRDKVRRIPVVENSKVIGVVALSDVALCRDYKIECARALCEISK